MPKLSNYINHYEVDAEKFNYFDVHVNNLVEDKRRFEEHFRLLKLNAGDKLVEIGSGAGHPAPMCENMKVKYIPLDLSLINLKKIKNQNRSSTPIFCDGYHLALKENSTDSIIISEVLEHLDDPQKVIDACLPILKPGGKISISVPWKEHIIQHLCIHCNKPTPANAHLHSFDKKDLISLVEKSGFNVLYHGLSLQKDLYRVGLPQKLRGIPYKYWRPIDQFILKTRNSAISQFLLAEKK